MQFENLDVSTKIKQWRYKTKGARTKTARVSKKLSLFEAFQQVIKSKYFLY